MVKFTKDKKYMISFRSNEQMYTNISLLAQTWKVSRSEATRRLINRGLKGYVLTEHRPSEQTSLPY